MFITILVMHNTAINPYKMIRAILPIAVILESIGKTTYNRLRPKMKEEIVSKVCYLPQRLSSY